MDQSECKTVRAAKLEGFCLEILMASGVPREEAEIVALIGANGAGKSTLLNTIMSLVDTKSGQIFFDGQEVTSKTTREIVQLGIRQKRTWIDLDLVGAEGFTVPQFREVGAVPRRVGAHEVRHPVQNDLEPGRAKKRGGLACPLRGVPAPVPFQNRIVE